MEPILLSILTVVVGALGAGLRAWLKTLLTPARMETLINMARTVVAAADEIGNALTLPPSEKYAYAEDALRDLAKRTGVRLTDSEVNALIHAVLYGEHAAEEQAAAERQYLDNIMAKQEPASTLASV